MLSLETPTHNGENINKGINSIILIQTGSKYLIPSISKVYCMNSHNRAMFDQLNWLVLFSRTTSSNMSADNVKGQKQLGWHTMEQLSSDSHIDIHQRTWLSHQHPSEDKSLASQSNSPESRRMPAHTSPHHLGLESTTSWSYCILIPWRLQIRI